MTRADAMAQLLAAEQAVLTAEAMPPTWAGTPRERVATHRLRFEARCQECGEQMAPGTLAARVECGWAHGRCE